MSVATTVGLIRSVLIYHALPGRIRRLTHFYSQFLEPGDLCFDIGAHVGNHLRAMRRLDTKVIAVEPQPKFARFLRRFYASDRGVVILDQALAANVGEAQMFISPRMPTVSTLSSSWRELTRDAPSFTGVRWDTIITVSLTTLDAMIAQYGLPAFCKIDVEGYEFEVLQGLSWPLPLLAFEYLPAARDLALACIERLDKLGKYEFNWSVGEQMKLNPSWATSVQALGYIRNLSDNAREGNLYARLQKSHG